MIFHFVSEKACVAEVPFFLSPPPPCHFVQIVPTFHSKFRAQGLPCAFGRMKLKNAVKQRGRERDCRASWNGLFLRERQEDEQRKEVGLFKRKDTY